MVAVAQEVAAVVLVVAAALVVPAVALVVAAVAQARTAERAKDVEEERYLSVVIFLFYVK